MGIEIKRAGLCHRCEHRARAMEGNGALRHECGQSGQSVVSCYAYQPVRPVVLRRNENDERLLNAPTALRGRSHFAGLLEGRIGYNYNELRQEMRLYWIYDQETAA